MNRYFPLSLVVFVLLGYSFTASALDSRCFTEYAEVPSDNVGNIFSVWAWDNIFFVQDGTIIPSWLKSSIVRRSYDYTLSNSLAKNVIDQKSALIDDLRETQLRIDPVDAPSWFDITLSFENKLKKRTFIPVIDIATSKAMKFEIASNDGVFIEVRQNDLSNYSFSSLRISFAKEVWPQTSVSIKTLRFDQRNNDIYIIKSQQKNPILAYRGWICSDDELFALTSKQSGISQDMNLDVPTDSAVLLEFLPIPTTGRDTDSDGIIDMRDNCSWIANKDQKDRNFDGIGDVCSDDDGDMIVWDHDNCPIVKNRDQKDQNANNIGDACEFDTDRDGVPDGVDNCIHTSNPDQKDSDNDGIGDVCDRCALFDPDQLDLDQNGIGDVCDDKEKYLKTHDSDNDGILDAQDNAPKIANPDQKDTDQDSIGDVADNCPAIKNPDQKDQDKNKIGDMCDDSDGDTIEGWRDNCPTIKNSDQRDANNDGIGDMCEDNDHDTIYNTQDNCPKISNNDQKDTDKDGIWNVCDDKDDRLIESNRGVFIALFSAICLAFIAWIVYFVRKLQL